MTDRDIIAASERLLKPYRIPASSPYLSEDQRELSLLDIQGRSEWMAEWLELAATQHSLPPTQGRRAAQMRSRARIRVQGRKTPV